MHLAELDHAGIARSLSQIADHPLADGTLERLAVPVRDVTGFAAAPEGGVLLLTSEGLVTVWP